VQARKYLRQEQSVRISPDIHAAISVILYEDWAPLGWVGLLPDDEYDSYIDDAAQPGVPSTTETAGPELMTPANLPWTHHSNLRTSIQRVSPRFTVAMRALGVLLIVMAGLQLTEVVTGAVFGLMFLGPSTLIPARQEDWS